MPSKWLRMASFAVFVSALLANSAGCQTWKAGPSMMDPSRRDVRHPQYFAPDPEFPQPRELASQEDPEGAARRAGGSEKAEKAR
jgi:hypothetical protein